MKFQPAVGLGCSLDTEALAKSLMGWAVCFPNFSMDHARYGARLAQIIIEGIETLGGEQLEGLGAVSIELAQDLALDIAWIFWIDDCFDLYPEESSDELLSMADFEVEDLSMPLEAWSASFVRSSFRVERRPEAAWRVWTESVVEMIRAFQHNKRRSRMSEGSWSYEEYLENGELSSAVPHFLATVSLLCGLDLHERMEEPGVRALLRNVSLAMRLENDIVSAGNEIEEGDNANALLIVSEFMGMPAAQLFVERQRRMYEEGLFEAIAVLGPDPMAQAARLVLEGAHWFHATERERYSGAHPVGELPGERRIQRSGVSAAALS